MSRPIPPLNALRAFEVAARHLSFTRAADELFVTPSAVSHQIKTLEENLGMPLFLRDSKSLTLTAAGKAYLPGVQEAFKQLVFATHQLHQSQGVPSLKINLPPTFAVKWLTPRMQRFMQAHPDIDLKISTAKEMVDFTREDFDMAVRYGRGTYPGLYSELCLPVEVFPVCSPALLQDPARPLKTPQDLRRHTLLHDESTYPDVSNPNWAMWLEQVGATDVDSTRGPSFWPSHLVIGAALDGLGVALAKKHWVVDDIARGRLVRPFEGSMQVEFAYYLIFPEDRAADPRINAFLAWVREELARDAAAQAAPTDGASR
ncbi:transcriptional regulator GcvA [Pseudorhodoferax sp. LjRoot39]|uniref:transcriptional regulator GcvA n=1 Tax=Pseudorhodoferax sp. LjRoot39 TaxID=3342328 RepID=UPI003ECC56DB